MLFFHTAEVMRFLRSANAPVEMTTRRGGEPALSVVEGLEMTTGALLYDSSRNDNGEKPNKLYFKRSK